jgi:hypothetical protein
MINDVDKSRSRESASRPNAVGRRDVAMSGRQKPGGIYSIYNERVRWASRAIVRLCPFRLLVTSTCGSVNVLIKFPLKFSPLLGF